MVFLASNGQFQNYNPTSLKMLLRYTTKIKKTSVNTLRSENCLFDGVLKFQFLTLYVCACISVSMYVCVLVCEWIYMCLYANILIHNVDDVTIVF